MHSKNYKFIFLVIMATMLANYHDIHSAAVEKREMGVVCCADPILPIAGNDKIDGYRAIVLSEKGEEYLVKLKRFFSGKENISSEQNPNKWRAIFYDSKGKKCSDPEIIDEKNELYKGIRASYEIGVRKGFKVKEVELAETKEKNVTAYRCLLQRHGFKSPYDMVYGILYKRQFSGKEPVYFGQSYHKRFSYETDTISFSAKPLFADLEAFSLMGREEAAKLGVAQKVSIKPERAIKDANQNVPKSGFKDSLSNGSIFKLKTSYGSCED